MKQKYQISRKIWLFLSVQMGSAGTLFHGKNSIVYWESVSRIITRVALKSKERQFNSYLLVFVDNEKISHFHGYLICKLPYSENILK